LLRSDELLILTEVVTDAVRFDRKPITSAGGGNDALHEYVSDSGRRVFSLRR